MTSNLIWSKYGENQGRAYRSKGRKVTYRIGMDPITDRWVLTINSVRSADNFDSLNTAKEMAELYETQGRLMPSGKGSPTGMGMPRILHAHGSPATLSARRSENGQKPKNGKDGTAGIDNECLVCKLHDLIVESGITPLTRDMPWQPWTSGVYALLDCVFRARMNYDLVVLPMLARVAARPGLNDHPELKFSALVNDIDTFGPDKFIKYADQVLTRNKLAGRLKVEISYEVCKFFVDRNIDTIADMRNSKVNMEELILEELQSEVHGIGPALSHYLLSLVGYEDHVKLDPLIIRFWGRMNTWVPRPSQQADYDVVLDTFRNVAERIGTTPARLDHAIWRYES